MERAQGLYLWLHDKGRGCKAEVDEGGFGELGGRGLDNRFANLLF